MKVFVSHQRSTISKFSSYDQLKIYEKYQINIMTSSKNQTYNVLNIQVLTEEYNESLFPYTIKTLYIFAQEYIHNLI